MANLEPGKSVFYDALAVRGISRRTFLKFCGGIAAALGLAETMTPKVAEAIEIGASNGKLAPVIWIEGASCTGCTESFAQIGDPDVASVVLDMISLNYSETLGAGAGHSFEQAKEDTIEAGGYVLVYEGAVVTGWDGDALRVADEKGTEILTHAAESAVAVIALGSCAVDGGWMAGSPNPAGAMGVQKFLEGEGITTPVVNIPGCPANPENLMAVLTRFLMAGQLPALDHRNMPTELFGQTIHDNCPRRGHFENGEFVYRFGSREEEMGYCLYAMGCKGPQTYANCPKARYNRKTSWCIEAGAPCIGCSHGEPTGFNNNWVDVNAPFLGTRFRNIDLGGFVFQPEIAAVAVTGAVAVLIGVHAYGMKAAGRTHGAPIEKETDYDRKRRLKYEAAHSNMYHDYEVQSEGRRKLVKQRALQREKVAQQAVKNAEEREAKVRGVQADENADGTNEESVGGDRR